MKTEKEEYRDTINHAEILNHGLIMNRYVTQNRNIKFFKEFCESVNKVLGIEFIGDEANEEEKQKFMFNVEDIYESYLKTKFPY
jgi:hypothetical protein